MDTRRLLREYPLQALLAAATVAALFATLVVAAGGAASTTTLRLGALTFVLFVFTLGFSAGPLGERYV
ncbi:hypothetical protein [Halobaculum roseum]|uniref:Uncharacterized protein n=1 Tax=Halobaculum roseum TaxID=2175149 RepID=A0ABD5MJX6_9EURY|nr:hypothetical protein [Halobaculum roseum]QZY03429.1 hypothetical protein K6T36_04470 [Halobaculum roseum]